MHDKRPSDRELTKRLNEAKEFLKNRHGLFASPSKAVGELNDLDIGDTNDVWQLIRELLEEITPKNYKGTRPPQKSYEKAIAGLELLAFSWWSPKYAKQMYIKFVLKNERYYYVSLIKVAQQNKKEKIKMKCLNCDCEKFESKNIRFNPEIKGEEVEVVVPSFVCTKCQTPLMDGEQMNVLRRCAADKYRKQHNLLTSEEIIKYRASLGMSQAAFANYLKVGEASIKRWETYFVQDVVQDDHIRLKCDEAYAELNALEVHWKSQSSDIYSGNRTFCLELFKQAVRYLIGFTKSPLFLNKALFYVDFKHFQKHGMSITGARYVHLEYGPCPDQFQNIYQLFLFKGVLISGGHHILKSIEKPNLSVFSDSEKEVLEFVAQVAHKDGGQKLLKVSHEELAFKKTEPLQLISYEFAKELKI